MYAVERRSRNPSLQRETQSGELGRCFQECREKIGAVDGLREKFPKLTNVTRDEAANMVAAGKIRDEADGWGNATSFRPSCICGFAGMFSCDKKIINSQSQTTRKHRYTSWSTPNSNSNYRFGKKLMITIFVHTECVHVHVTNFMDAAIITCLQVNTPPDTCRKCKTAFSFFNCWRGCRGTCTD